MKEATVKNQGTRRAEVKNVNLIGGFYIFQTGR